MPLSTREIASAKPREKAFKLFDGHGLHVEVFPTGSKRWRVKYRFNSVEKKLSLGCYPEISLAEAREQCDDARQLLRKGIDPSLHKRAQKSKDGDAPAPTFGMLVDEYLQAQAHQLSPNTLERNKRIFDQQLKPWLKDRPITAITAGELLTTLRVTEDRGKLETVGRARNLASAVFRFGIASARCTADPARDLAGALKTPVSNRRAALTDPKKIGGLLRAIDCYGGQPVTRAALKLSPYLFCRPGELRHAEWSEIDLDSALWRIPPEKTKMRDEHVIPLSSQSVEILRNIRPLTKSSRYVFPGARSLARPLSENTINAALRSLGFEKDQMSAHGFRAMASTVLNEQGYSPDLIEKQLAHTERNKVRAAYNRASYLDQRRRMMQEWADFLDSVRHGADVVPISARQSKTA